MIHKHKHVKRAVRYFSDFAIHIWVILLLANVLLVYTFHFYIHASSSPAEQPQQMEESLVTSFNDMEQETEVEEPIPTLTPEPTEVIPPVPNGPLLGLSFSVPGIGSAGGNLKPIHPTRNVTIYLYPTGVNSLDKKIRPVNTIKTKATYDSNENSPTYMRFVNPKIDLGSRVADGDYQIVIKTDKSFRTLIKEKSTNIGGIVYSLERRSDGDEHPILPHQKMVMGDLFPLDEGDNAVDLNDYAVLVNCFQQIRGKPECPDPTDADLNDDGMVDGLDYNVMVLSYAVLQEQGITVPKILILPTGSNVSRLSYLTPKLTKTPASPTPTLVPDEPKEQGGGGGLIAFIFMVLFFGALGGGAFILYLKNPQVKAMIDGLIHKSPAGKPANPQDQAASVAQPGSQSSQQNAPVGTKTTEKQSNSSTNGAQQPSSQTSGETQKQTATPEGEKKATDNDKAAVATTVAGTAASAPGAPQQDSGQAKEYFVKKQSEDETKTGFWVTITDDKGPQLAHYKGTEVVDGFANIKGEIKTENGKTFLEITELVPEG